VGIIRGDLPAVKAELPAAAADVGEIAIAPDNRATLSDSTRFARDPMLHIGNPRDSPRQDERAQAVQRNQKSNWRQSYSSTTERLTTTPGNNSLGRTRAKFFCNRFAVAEFA